MATYGHIIYGKAGMEYGNRHGKRKRTRKAKTGGALFTPSEGPHVTKPLRHLHEVALVILNLHCTVLLHHRLYHNTYIL